VRDRDGCDGNPLHVAVPRAAGGADCHVDSLLPGVLFWGPRRELRDGVGSRGAARGGAGCGSTRRGAGRGGVWGRGRGVGGGGRDERYGMRRWRRGRGRRTPLCPPLLPVAPSKPPRHRRPRNPPPPSTTDKLQEKIASALKKADGLFTKMRSAWTRLVNKVPSLLKNNSWFQELTTDIGEPLFLPRALAAISPLPHESLLSTSLAGISPLLHDPLLLSAFAIPLLLLLCRPPERLRRG
jgi:hypothetical protein